MAGTVTFKGSPMHLVGPQLQVGDPAPDVTLTKPDFSPIQGRSALGKVIVVSVTPSLDTSVCDLQAKRFNEAAAELGEGVLVCNVSVDLPPALARWCGATGATNLLALSDYRDRSFGTQWGVLIDELKLLARAVFVVDREGCIAYREVVPEVTDHPDYEAALAAARKLL